MKQVKLNKKDKAKVEALPAEEQAAAKEAIIEKAKKDDLKKLTLAPVAARLNELLDGKVTFAKDVVGPDAQAKVAACKEGECVLLENLRVYSKYTPTIIRPEKIPAATFRKAFDLQKQARPIPRRGNGDSVRCEGLPSDILFFHQANSSLQLLFQHCH